MAPSTDPCVLCGKPVEPGTGAQRVDMIPAMHSACIRKASEHGVDLVAAFEQPAPTLMAVADACGEPSCVKDPTWMVHWHQRRIRLCEEHKQVLEQKRNATNLSCMTFHPLDRGN